MSSWIATHSHLAAFDQRQDFRAVHAQLEIDYSAPDQGIAPVVEANNRQNVESFTQAVLVQGSSRWQLELYQPGRRFMAAKSSARPHLHRPWRQHPRARSI